MRYKEVYTRKKRDVVFPKWVRYLSIVGIIGIVVILLLIASAEQPSIINQPSTSPAAHTIEIQFGDCFDLDTRTIIPKQGLDGDCPGSTWDIYFAYDSRRTPHAALVQNPRIGTRVAYSNIVTSNTFDILDRSLMETFTFSDGRIDVPFEQIAVIETAVGNYYKAQLIREGRLGRNEYGVTFQWERLQ